MFIAKSNINHDGIIYPKGADVGKIPQESLNILIKDGIVELVGNVKPVVPDPKSDQKPDSKDIKTSSSVNAPKL